MSLVPSFVDLLQPFALVMTILTFRTFSWLVSGWLFAPRRTITGMMLAAGVVGHKHHSAFHRVFSAAHWSLDGAGLALFDLLSVWLEELVFLAVDDTLTRKRGLKVFGVGMHLDQSSPAAGPSWSTGAIAGWSWACWSAFRCGPSAGSACRSCSGCT